MTAFTDTANSLHAAWPRGERFPKDLYGIWAQLARLKLEIDAGNVPPLPLPDIRAVFPPR